MYIAVAATRPRKHILCERLMLMDAIEAQQVLDALLEPSADQGRAEQPAD